MSEIRIYVACLASYNAGKLHGKWIDADRDEEDIMDDIRSMLRESPCPNVAVECPSCQGRKLVERESDSAPVVTCDVCHGKGEVPSAEEWAVHDYEGFSGLKLGEHPDIEQLAEVARLLEEHGEAYAAFAENIGIADADEGSFQEAFRGEFDSKEDYAQNYVEETCDLKNVPDLIKNHIDYESIARDMEQGGEIWFHDHSGGVYVFANY